MRYRRGEIVVVPFPFTDLSKEKQRPALVVSPDWFNEAGEDVVLSAMTSVIPDPFDAASPGYVDIQLSDVFGAIPQRSIVKVTKFFTCSQNIIIKKAADLKPERMDEVLRRIRAFFSSGYSVHEPISDYQGCR